MQKVTYRTKSDIPHSVKTEARLNIAAVLREAGASQAQMDVLMAQLEQRSWRRLAEAGESLARARAVAKEELCRLAENGGYRKGGNSDVPKRAPIRCRCRIDLMDRMREAAKRNGRPLIELMEDAVDTYLEEVIDADG